MASVFISVVFPIITRASVCILYINTSLVKVFCFLQFTKRRQTRIDRHLKSLPEKRMKEPVSKVNFSSVLTYSGRIRLFRHGNHLKKYRRKRGNTTCLYTKKKSVIADNTEFSDVKSCRTVFHQKISQQTMQLHGTHYKRQAESNALYFCLFQLIQFRCGKRKDTISDKRGIHNTRLTRHNRCGWLIVNVRWNCW